MYRVIAASNRLYSYKELEIKGDINQQRGIIMRLTLRQKLNCLKIPAFISTDAKLNQQKKEQLKNKEFTQILKEGHNHI